MNKQTINQEVTVTGLYFTGREMKTFPKRMEFNGREYTFIESGLRFLVKRGQQFIQIFTMTDGAANYRLKFDTQERLWTLMDITEAPRAFA